MGQTLYSISVDRLHRQLYVVTSAQNTGSRSIMRLPLDALPPDPSQRVGCEWGHTLLCRFRGLGAALVVGNQAAMPP